MSPAAGISEIVRSLALTEEEAALVRQEGSRLSADVESWVERFYARLLQDPTAMRILRDEQRVLRLQKSLIAWLHEAFSLPLDQGYERARRTIGERHVAIALPQHLMVTAMGGLQRDVAASIGRLYAGDRDLAARLRVAIGKTLDLELALMLEAYVREKYEAAPRAPPQPQPPTLQGPARGESVRTLADIGRATSTFAHEIRNPLAALAGAVDLLSRDLAPSERGEIVGLAKARLDHMRRLLDDTLRLAHPVRGEPEPVDLAEVVRSALETVRTDPAFRRVDVQWDGRGLDAPARGHAEPLRQAVLNLLLNAAEALAGAGSVRVSVSSEEGMAVIRVADDGPGIPAAKREVVFDPFWTTKPRGTGLGLSYVRRVAEAAGGRAEAEDVPTGACIAIRLPV